MPERPLIDFIVRLDLGQRKVETCMNYGFKYCCRVSLVSWYLLQQCTQCNDLNRANSYSEMCIHLYFQPDFLYWAAILVFIRLLSPLFGLSSTLQISSTLWCVSLRMIWDPSACVKRWGRVSQKSELSSHPYWFYLRRILPCCRWRKVFHSDHADTIWLF